MKTEKIEGVGLGNNNNISQYSISRDMSNPNASSSKGKITTLKGFLLSHRAKDGEEVTHTRIGDSKSNIYGGKYNIPDNELHDFFEIYKKDLRQLLRPNQAWKKLYFNRYRYWYFRI